MKEKKVKIDPVTNEVEVPIDLTKYEHERLKEKLELFNKNVAEDSKLTFEEFISLVFEVSLLEDELDTKYNYSKRLEAEVDKLEKELLAKYSIGLIGSEEVYNEVIELRKQALEDSLNYAKNYKLDYINLISNVIDFYSETFDDEIEERVLTFEDILEIDVEKNPSDVLKAIKISKAYLKPSESHYKEKNEALDIFETKVKHLI